MSDLNKNEELNLNVQNINIDNPDDINKMLYKILTDIIKIKQTDVTELLLSLETIYLADKYQNIEPIILFLLNHVYEEYLCNLASPYYKNIINSIITWHIVRTSNKLIVDFNTSDPQEKETATYFDID